MLLIWILLCFFVSNVFGTPIPILGGVNAEEKKYKYLVSLQEVKKNQHFCGGSVISDFWILTAGHCVDNGRIRKDITRIRIVAGITNLSDEGDAYFVSSLDVHENWNKEIIANDIAVLKTTKKIQFSSAVKPILLANHNPPDGTITTLTGWGFTSESVGLGTTPVPNTLQVAHFETISVQECRKQFNDAKYPGKLVTHTNICIAQPVDKGQCNGDSGGVLMYNGTQIGIVSFGGQCGESLPGFMTSVTKFLDWIKEKTGI